MKKAAVFIFDEFPDWEPALAIAGLHALSPVKVQTFGISKAPVTSRGGLKVLPDLSLEEVDLSATALVLLPGGDPWADPGANIAILPLIREAVEWQVPVAAICASTLFLARNGFLEGVKHTSNDKGYMLYLAPDYKGQELYQDRWAVADRHIITANGIAPVEFAHAVFEELGITGGPAFEEWYQYFRLRLQYEQQPSTLLSGKV